MKYNLIGIKITWLPAIMLLAAAGQVFAQEACPVETLYGQAPHTPLDSFQAWASDELAQAMLDLPIPVDNFSGVTDPICDVHWWGFEMDASAFPCNRTPQNVFVITFYQDSGGMPGTVACTRTVTATKTDTGLSYSADFGYGAGLQSYPLYRYDAVLSPCCSLAAGWVSIAGKLGASLATGCAFVIVSSGGGDNVIFMDNGVTFLPDVGDMAFCLTATGAEEECVAVDSLSCGDSRAGNNAGQPSNIDSYPCVGWLENGPEMVYSFTVPADTSVTVQLSGLSADLDLFVLEGTCLPANCIAHGDSQALFSAEAGVPYYIVVDGRSGAVSSYTIQVTCVGGGEGEGECVFVNPGFETGDFDGWSTSGSGGLEDWTVAIDAMGYFGNGTPHQGTHFAQNGFDGNQGLTYDIYQEVAIPSSSGTAMLTWAERIQWDMESFPGSTLSRVYAVTVQPQGGGMPLATLFTTTLDPDTSGDTGWVEHAVDLLAAAPGTAGSTVRINWHEYIPESSTGPAQFDLDGICLGFGALRVTDSIPPEYDHDMPFSPPNVPVGEMLTEHLTITNPSAETRTVNNIEFPTCYIEDFEDGQAQGWVESSASDWEVASGEYRADPGMSGVFMKAHYEEETWGDCSITATCRYTGDDSAIAGVALRATSDLNWESGGGSGFFAVVDGMGYYWVAKSVSGSLTFLVGYGLSSNLNTGGTPNEITLSVEGNSWEVYFNGNLEWSGVDSDVAAPGYAALLACSGFGGPGVNYFDNVTVCEPSGAKAEEAAFRLEGLPSFPLALDPQETLTVDMVFEPPSAGSFSRSVLIESDDPFTPEVSVSLSGRGKAGPWSDRLWTFEPGMEDLTIDNDYGDGNGLWHISTDCASAESGHSLPTSLYYGIDGPCNYDNGFANEGVVTSQVIDLTNVEPPIALAFNYYLETEGDPASYDQAYVEVSENSGPFLPVASNDPTLGVLTLVDPTAEWESAMVDLSAMSGSTIQFRFHFVTTDDWFNAYPGFFVDDVALTGISVGVDVTDSIPPGFDYELPFSPPYVALGASRTEHVTVTNTGSIAVDVSSIAFDPLGGPKAGGDAFRLENLPSLPATMAPDDSFVFDVVFDPPAGGTFNGQVTLNTEADMTPPPLSEDFTDGLAQDWQEVEDENWSVASGEYRGDSLGVPGFFGSVYTPLTFQDGTIAADVRRTGELDNFIHVFARASSDFHFPDNGHAYVLGI
ncbi:MAG: choice-of-anchor D domain-containing protein, partial [Candidatus Hydrogenedentes bacterium]|nr:choice-of-anchor D domain-containing protein [Candidatus Hydrogenedentota bacterium]